MCDKSSQCCLKSLDQFAETYDADDTIQKLVDKVSLV